MGLDSTAIERGAVIDTAGRATTSTVDLWQWIPPGVKTAGAVIGTMWGGVPGMVQTLLILMAVDILIGSIRALRDRAYAQGKATKRVTMKIGIVVVVGVLAVLDADGFLPVPLATYAAGWYAAHEGISIFRNLVAMEVPMPGPIIRVLEAWQRQKEGAISPATSADRSAVAESDGQPSAEKSPDILTGAERPE